MILLVDKVAKVVYDDDKSNTKARGRETGSAFLCKIVQISA